MVTLSKFGMWAKAMFWGNKAQALHELQVHQIELEMQNADLRQAQKEMDAERTRYLDLYDHSPVGYCTLDPQGLILETNLTATTLLGETKDELVKQSLSRFINKEDLELFHGNRKQLFDNDEPQAYELRMVRKGGVDFWASLETTVAQDAEGKPVCRVVLSDITQRKKAEAELVKMQNLQSVGTLAGVIAHDFNNILMGLFGNIALAKDELPKDHPGFALLEEAEKSMSRAVRLTKQLLTFSKGGSPVKEDINLAALAEEVALFDLSGSQVKLVFHPSKDLWLVEADKGQIQQVVSNLTINARQAMPHGGCLYITLENADILEVAVSGLQQGKYVKVVVRDEGIGIDQKRLARIFDPFFTVKQTGNGLGLATVYSVIKKHGGHIEVVSELGKGTTFTFYLPAEDSPQHADKKQSATEYQAPARPARILVMDDEEMVRGIVAKMLKRCGYSVVTAPGGEEALALYKQAMSVGVPLDVVIMDLTIPGGVGGKDAIKGLLEFDPAAKAIVSSGYADDPVMANYAEYGFKGIVAKPYTQDQLIEVLRQVLK